MTQVTKLFRPVGVTAAIILTSATLVAVPAHGASASEPLTRATVTDGTTSGDEVTYSGGTDVTMVFNDSTSGDFTFDGCWNVEADGTLIASTETSTSQTWTAGTAVDVLFPSIDLSPENDTWYDIRIYSRTVGLNCEFAEESVSLGFISMQILAPEAPIDPFTMTLIGSPRIGSTVTVQANEPGTLVGQDFDLWACPTTDVLPVASDPTAAEAAGCVGPFIQTRTGDTTSFFLGYVEERDAQNPDAPDFWADVCDQYFTVNDYPGGGHANWIGPIDCSPAPADTVTPAAQLAKTGGESMQMLAGAAGALLALSGALLVARRRRRATNAH